MEFLLLFIALFLLVPGVLLLMVGKGVRSLWREPVLKYPVVIFESDDWGPAEPFEADRLRRIASVLRAFKDTQGRHPVMTLGVVLSVPDASQMSGSGFSQYHAVRLDDDRFSSICEAISDGMQDGVFAIQLHGMAHYLPETLMRAAESDPAVKGWLMQAKVPDPWNLPSSLQSRWIDGTSLPSGVLESATVEKEAAEEAAVFRQVFGNSPDVAVPPTFIWPPEVEKAWAKEGVRYVVTPGIRNDGRDAEGKPRSTGETIQNGQRGEGGPVTYLVRDDYFEPNLGHSVNDVLVGLSMKAKLGRPVLFETHRFNFNGTEAECNNALDELNQALQSVLDIYPSTRFLTSAELGDVLQRNDPRWIETHFFARLRYFQRRVRKVLPIIRRFFPISV